MTWAAGEPVRGGAAAYQLIAPLRSGAYGELWLASAAGGDEVVIKAARGGGAPDLQAEIAFERDRQEQIRGLTDRVVTFLDTGVHDGRPFVVQPRFDGDLVDWAGGAPGLAERLDVIHQLCGALARLQDVATTRREVYVHRDIKPANLLYRRTPSAAIHVVLADFGLMRRVDDPRGHTGRGTLAYMAWDAMLARGRPVDPWVDMFALGATAFWILTEHTPVAVSEHMGALTEIGRRLYWLTNRARRAVLSLGEQREMEALGARPDAALVHLERLVSLSPVDVARLQHIIERAAEVDGVDPSVVGLVVEELQDALGRLLHPDPTRRPTRPEELAVAARRSRDLWSAQTVSRPVTEPVGQDPLNEGSNPGDLREPTWSDPTGSMASMGATASPVALELSLGTVPVDSLPPSRVRRPPPRAPDGPVGAVRDLPGAAGLPPPPPRTDAGRAVRWISAFMVGVVAVGAVATVVVASAGWMVQSCGAESPPPTLYQRGAY